jgi:hypothetical protein
MKPTVVLGMAQPYPGYDYEQVTIVASRILDTIVAFGQTRHNIKVVRCFIERRRLDIELGYTHPNLILNWWAMGHHALTVSISNCVPNMMFQRLDSPSEYSIRQGNLTLTLL